MSQESAQNKLKHFWNTEQGVHKTSVGGLGGGEELESDYRAYFELKHLKNIVPFDPKNSLLELGSGKGRWALVLAPLVGQYEGVDFSEISLKAAKCAVGNTTSSILLQSLSTLKMMKSSKLSTT